MALSATFFHLPERILCKIPKISDFGTGGFPKIPPASPVLLIVLSCWIKITQQCLIYARVMQLSPLNALSIF